jgi:hypothetical protein
MTNYTDPKTDTIAETENYIAWLAEEMDGETTYNLGLNNVTLHFFKEEWDEFLDLARLLIKGKETGSTGNVTK